MNGSCHSGGVGADQGEDDEDEEEADASRIFQRLRVHSPWRQPDAHSSHLALSSHLPSSHLASSHLASSVATHSAAAPVPSLLAPPPTTHEPAEQVSLAKRLYRLSQTPPDAMTPAQLDCVLMPPPPNRPSKLQRVAQLQQQP